jgi:phosphoribosylanthranilate isomerase
MIIKVCGITNPRDAQAAIDAGATAIGFNFYPESPRYVTADLAGDISTPGVRRVGVFVNEDPDRIIGIAGAAGCDTIQLHGDETNFEFPRRFTVWKAVRVSPDVNFAAYADLPVEALLLDGPAGELYGGAGRTFDWSLAAAIGKRIIVAGGLDDHNVARAVELARPWGVDSCSRIESSPGVKDHTKMNRYIQAAKRALIA